MKSAIDDFLLQQLPAISQSLEQLDRQIPADAEPTSEYVLAELSRCLYGSLAVCRQLEKQLEGEDPALVKDLQKKYREAIWPWIRKSWCMNRSIVKPRGYPGDYQMLTTIYDNTPRSKGLGGYLDRFWLNLTLARAVAGRMIALRDFLVDELARREGKVTVLNVACGACREYTEDFRIPAETLVALTCIDNDEEALDYVRQNVAPHVAENLAIDCVRYNALRMTSSAANIKRFGYSDIICSVGLCDYIPDEYLVPMLKGWRESLAERGIVYVAFKDALLYDKTEYQWLLDWYFFQRTEPDFIRLFREAGYDLNQIEARRDVSGVIINYCCRTSGIRNAFRLDGAQQVPVPQGIENGSTASIRTTQPS
jgi:SAM-dependent methyltransferase